MKISIDTAADSKEDIRKAIRLLQSLVEHDTSQGSRNLFDAPGAGLFDSGPPTKEQLSEPSASPAAAFGSLFGDDAPAQQAGGLPEEKKDVPQIEFY